MNIKILLIEDDPIWQLKIQTMLVESLYPLFVIASNLTEAVEYLKTNQVDMIVSDVELSPDSQIFELDEWLKDIPTVFVTNFAREEVLQRVLLYPHASFLIKPFHYLSLKSILDRFAQKILQSKQEAPVRVGGIHVFNKFRHKILLPFETILWIEADGNYTYIITQEKKHSIKKSLTLVSLELNEEFVQIQRGYIVRKASIERVDFTRNFMVINKQNLPIGRAFRSKLMDLFG